MYKYEYETISCVIGGWGLSSDKIYSIDNYRFIIDKKAESGWRYVGYIPTKQLGTGYVQEIDLIFEKTIF